MNIKKLRHTHVKDRIIIINEYDLKMVKNSKTHLWEGLKRLIAHRWRSFRRTISVRNYSWEPVSDL